MPTSHVIRFVAVLLVVVALAGCAFVGIGPGLPDGGRRWVITVENQSFRPATLVVVAGGRPTGPVIGTVNPSVVPTGATVDVVL